LFHATTIPGILLCELLPPEDRVPLSRPLAPLRLSTGVQKRTVRSLVTPGFTDSHALARLPGSPSSYGLPFARPRSTSRLPWAPCGGFTSFRQLHPLRSFPPLVRPFQPLRVAPRPLAAARSLFPFEAFSSHALSSLPAQVLRPVRLLGPKTSERGSKDRQPLKPGEDVPSTSTQTTSSTASSPIGAGLRRLSPTALLSWPWISSELATLTFRASKYVESGVSPERAPAPLRFLASSPAS